MNCEIVMSVGKPAGSVIDPDGGGTKVEVPEPEAMLLRMAAEIELYDRETNS